MSGNARNQDEMRHAQDRSFTFILKTPPASVLLQKAAGIQKGSGTPNSKKVGKVTMAQLRVSISPITPKPDPKSGWILPAVDLSCANPEL